MNCQMNYNTTNNNSRKLVVNQFGGSYEKGRPLPLEIRETIITMFKAKVPQKTISRSLKISESCVSKLISKFKRDKSNLPGAIGINRWQLMTDKTELEIIQAFKSGITDPHTIRDHFLKTDSGNIDLTPSVGLIRRTVEHFLKDDPDYAATREPTKVYETPPEPEFTRDQVLTMIETFETNPNMSNQESAVFADEIGARKKDVIWWFRNRKKILKNLGRDEWGNRLEQDEEIAEPSHYRSAKEVCDQYNGLLQLRDKRQKIDVQKVEISNFEMQNTHENARKTKPNGSRNLVNWKTNQKIQKPIPKFDIDQLIVLYNKTKQKKTSSDRYEIHRFSRIPHLLHSEGEKPKLQVYNATFYIPTKRPLLNPQPEHYDDYGKRSGQLETPGSGRTGQINQTTDQLFQYKRGAMHEKFAFQKTKSFPNAKKMNSKLKSCI